MTASIPATTPTNIEVRVEKNGMVATARRTSGTLPSPKELHVALEKAGVIDGRDEATIASILTGDVAAGRSVIVAQGTPSTEGVSARIEYSFVLADQNKPFGEVEDASTDFRQGILVEHVEPGDVLALKYPAVLGHAGRTVTGVSIPAPAVRDTPLLAGQNTKLSSDNLSLVAVAGGRPALIAGRVTVLPVFEVPAVQYASGNIHYEGAVVVKGDVAEGFIVCAAGDIEVRGVVEGAVLMSGGNVIVHGGVRHASRIEAAGDVRVRFVDSDSVVVAFGNVSVTASSTHSAIEALGSVVVAQSVRGGMVRAGERIETREAGTEGGGVTLLEVRRDWSPGQIQQLRANLDAATEAVRAFERSRRTRISEAPQVGISVRKQQSAREVQCRVDRSLAAAKLAVCERQNVELSEEDGLIFVRGKIHERVFCLIHGRLGTTELGRDGTRFAHDPSGQTCAVQVPAETPSRKFGSGPPLPNRAASSRSAPLSRPMSEQRGLRMPSISAPFPSYRVTAPKR